MHYIGFAKQAGAISQAIRANRPGTGAISGGAMRAATDFGRRSGARAKARGGASRAKELMQRAVGRVESSAAKRLKSPARNHQVSESKRYLPVAADAGAAQKRVG
jgi:hypothetical protein